MYPAFLLIVSGLLMYTVIPTFVIRLFGIGVYKKGTAGCGIALTFDDGPDPEYTPRLLEILKQYKIKATFFVLGSKAEQYPELIKQMDEDGHLIGIHNYVHWANAFMTPKKVRLQLNDSVNAIERIIGVKPVFYRPPWGVINIFDFLLMKRFRMILWSIIVGDWRSSGGKRKIKHRLLSRLKDGAVIVLHDSGQTFGADCDAPGHMLEALQEFIAEALSNGYSFLRVDEKIALEKPKHAAAVPLSLPKRMLLFIWFKWDQLFHVLCKIKPVDASNPLFFYRVVTFRGKTMLLSECEQLVSGDRVLELHFNNEKLFKLSTGSRSPVQLAVQMIRLVKEVLPRISAKIENNPEFSDVKAIYGITMIHRGADQLGFTSLALPRGWFSILANVYLKVLLYILHPEGSNRLKLKSNALAPKAVAISVHELKRRYCTEQVSVVGRQLSDDTGVSL